MGYTILCIVVTNTIKQMLMRFELNAKQPVCTKGAAKSSTISPWLCAYNAMWASTQKFAYPHISNGELSKKTRALWSCEFCIGFQAQTQTATHKSPKMHRFVKFCGVFGGNPHRNCVRLPLMDGRLSDGCHLMAGCKVWSRGA